MERPDGTRRTVMVNIIPRLDEFGKLNGAINCLVDITERRQSEDLLRTSEAKFRSITETANDAIVVVDSKGNVSSWNKGARIIPL